MPQLCRCHGITAFARCIAPAAARVGPAAPPHFNNNRLALLRVPRRPAVGMSPAAGVRPAQRRGFRRRTCTFSATVRHGSSRSFCSMKATWALGPSTRSPSTKATPSLGAVRPEPMLSNVDLPQPLGPISDTTSPSRTARLTCLHRREPLVAALHEMHRHVAVFEADQVGHWSDPERGGGVTRSSASVVARRGLSSIVTDSETADSLSAARPVTFCRGENTMSNTTMSRRLLLTTGAAAGLGLMTAPAWPQAKAGGGHLSVSGAADPAGVRADPARPGQGLFQGRRPRRRASRSAAAASMWPSRSAPATRRSAASSPTARSWCAATACR